MLVVAALSLFSVRVVARIILGLIILQVVAFVVLIFMLAINSHADFVSSLASYSHHPGAYQAIISSGKANGVVFGTSIAAAVAIIPFMVLNYNGVLYSYYVGGELRRPGRTYLYASAISIGVLVVLWIGVWALLRARVGLSFMQAQANLGVVNPTAYGKITSLSSVAGGLGYGMVLSTDPITKILFATAVPLAEIAVNLAFLTVTTRVLFAQAFDRLLPVNVAKVGERNHAPNVAIAIVLVIGSAFCLLTSLVNLGSIVALQSLFFALILLAGGIAATVLPMRRADLIDQSRTVGGRAQPLAPQGRPGRRRDHLARAVHRVRAGHALECVRQVQRGIDHHAAGGPRRRAGDLCDRARGAPAAQCAGPDDGHARTAPGVADAPR